MANITTQTIRVDLSTDKVIPSAFTHQNDTARTLVFDMYNGGMPYTIWTPTDAPSLWAKVLVPSPDVITDWEQPDSTNAYMTGDKVRYKDGHVYESLIDNNVWSPEAYPQGWKLIE